MGMKYRLVVTSPAVSAAPLCNVCRLLPSNPTVKGRSTGAHFRVLICSSATPGCSPTRKTNQIWRASLSVDPGPPVLLTSLFRAAETADRNCRCRLRVLQRRGRNATGRDEPNLNTTEFRVGVAFLHRLAAQLAG